MYVKQEFSILFFLRLPKADKKTGKAPLYYRLKIDGQSADRSLKGVIVHPEDWDNDTKIVRTTEPQHKAFNKKINNLKTDLERHFDLIQAKLEVATPELVLNAYKSPLRVDKRKDEKEQNLALSQGIDDFISRYLKFNDKWVKAYKHRRVPYPAEEALLVAQKTEIKEEFEALVKKGNTIFDEKDWEKTVILAVDEHLLHFMYLVLAGERSPNTLEKMWGRKKRYVDFLRDRYDTDHLPLNLVQYKFIDQLLSYNILQHKMIENSAMKYIQTIKEVFTRSVSIGWISANVFDSYHCHYNDVDQEWLPMDEMIRMINFGFSRSKLNEIRDVYVFACFSGYAFAEIESAGYDDLRVGVDGKQWIGKDRQKTGQDETLPLLPICLEIIERYSNHPVCLRRKSLLPVPSCEEYNRCLKEIGAEMGLNIELTTHTARYFFANVVANDNGLELRITGQLLGQKSLKTTAKYVKKNKRLLAENMQLVENKLFHEDGSLRGKKHPTTTQGAKVITLRIV